MMFEHSVITLEDNSKHFVAKDEYVTLCGIGVVLPDEVELKRALYWQQASCHDCRVAYATSPDRNVANHAREEDPDAEPHIPEVVEGDVIGPEYDPEVHDETFTISDEMRMRMVIFVRSLFKRKGLEVSFEEASKLLREDLLFTSSVIDMLTQHQNRAIRQIDEVDASPEAIEAAKKLFRDKAQEAE